VRYASEETESLVNTWAEKGISKITNERCNSEVHESYQSGRCEHILNYYDQGLEFIKAKPDERSRSFRQKIMQGESTSIQNTSFNDLTTKLQQQLDSMRITKSGNPITDPK
jgi:hypothetical protein